MSLLTPETFYVLAGLYLGAMAVRIAGDAGHPRRIGSALFWGLLAATFMFGNIVPSVLVGGAVLLMAGLAGARQVQPPRRVPQPDIDRTTEAARLGNRLLLPAILVPVLVIAGGFTLDRIRLGSVQLAASPQLTLTAIGLACALGLLVSMRITRSGPGLALAEGSRLLQIVGWALLLPQMLASLGGIFAQAGVGNVIADGIARTLPTQFSLVAVIAYCAGMTLFTIIMGNAYAAFPVITLGIGLPFIVHAHGGNPAIMGTLGMLSGYCGTLVTPMAANFNLVPALLLELEDKNAVIKAQLPMAAAIWLFNVTLMYFCVYRF